MMAKVVDGTLHVDTDVPEADWIKQSWDYPFNDAMSLCVYIGMGSDEEENKAKVQAFLDANPPPPVEIIDGLADLGYVDLVEKDRVRTPAGAKKYGVPIGTPITNRRGLPDRLRSTRAGKNLLNRLRNQGGFTVFPSPQVPLGHGISVAINPKASLYKKMDDLSADDIRSWIRTNADAFSEKGTMVGGWLDQSTNEVWLDIIKIFNDPEEAMRTAQEMNQKAIFDLDTGTEINTGGTGLVKSDRLVLFMFDPSTPPEKILRTMRRQTIEKCNDYSALTAIFVKGVPCKICGKEMTDKKSIARGFGSGHLKSKSPNIQRQVKRLLRAIGEGPDVPATEGMKKATKADYARFKKKYNTPIPPAWTNVKVDFRPGAALICHGYDSKARPQSIYSSEHSEESAEEKFNRIKTLDRKIRPLDRALGKDATTNPDAAAVLLMREFGLRPGSDRDTGGDKQAYGATNMLAHHAKISADGKTVTLRFVGKKGVSIEVSNTDPLVIKAIRAHKKGKGPNDPLFGTTPARAQAYLDEHLGDGFKLKDLRTLFANEQAAWMVEDMNAEFEPPETEAELKQWKNEVADAVSKVLGNTRAIALKAYINPTVFAEWEANIGD